MQVSDRNMGASCCCFEFDATFRVVDADELADSAESLIDAEISDGIHRLDPLSDDPLERGHLCEGESLLDVQDLNRPEFPGNLFGLDLSGHFGLIWVTTFSLDLEGRAIPELGVEALLVEPRDPCEVAIARSSRPFKWRPLSVRTTWLRCSSVLKMPITDSAMALLQESPPVPPEADTRDRRLGR